MLYVEDHYSPLRLMYIFECGVIRREEKREEGRKEGDEGNEGWGERGKRIFHLFMY